MNVRMLGVSLLGVLLACWTSAATATPKNVLMVVVDDQGRTLEKAVETLPNHPVAARNGAEVDTLDTLILPEMPAKWSCAI
jgi:hypothetical protein